jgi:23S rRNA pseudouridine2605 synthase
MSKVRLNKFLASSALGSRRKVEEIILSKSVKVNNQIVDDLSCQIDTKKDIVKVNDKIIKEKKKYYFLLNKPKGFICSNTQVSPIKKNCKNKKCKKDQLVIDLFKNYSTRLFTVGRLDKDTTGILLVTNDGDFANKVIHPSSNIEKEYFVKVKERLLDKHIEKIKKGSFIENKFVKPKKVLKTSDKTIKIVVLEGKKREIKVFIQRAKLTLLELKRVRIGNLMLGKIPIGFHQRLSFEEVSKIF